MCIRRYKIQGSSMEPSYKDGDRVVAVQFGKIKIGDVVVFKKNALTMIKRVQKIEQDQYTVKGDNWKESSDNFRTIKNKEILGKVIFKY